MKEEETMGIIAFEGASAVGKSTTCRELEKNYGAYIIPEVNLLFERPKMNIEHGILKTSRALENSNAEVRAI